MKKYLLTLSLLPLAVFNSQAHAAKIYTCEVNGSIVYTSRPSATAKPSMIYRLSANTAAADTTLRLVMRRHSMHRHHKRLRQKAKIRLQNPTIRQHPKPAPVRTASETAPPPVPKSSSVNSRRSILETELSNERVALADAKKQLSQARTAKGGSVNQQAISTLQGAVLDREKNIQALQRELGRM